MENIRNRAKHTATPAASQQPGETVFAPLAFACGQSQSPDVTVKMRGVQVRLVGVQITVEEMFGRGHEVKDVFFTRIPEPDFLFDDSDERSAAVIDGSPHGGVEILPEAFLFWQLFCGGPVE